MTCLYSYIGSAESNKVVNFVTCVQNYHYEPRFIKRCENDEETILVAINDFIVQGIIYMCICMGMHIVIHISLHIADFIYFLYTLKLYF